MKRIASLAIIVCLCLFASAGHIYAAASLTTLHVFTGPDGLAPEAGLCLGTNGNFYGTTVNGGTGTNCIDGCGTVFEISPAGAFTSLYSFNEDDGDSPRAGLLQASDGNLYGTTASGGPFAGLGTVFQTTPAGVLTNLYTFRGNDGIGPEGTLIQGQNGILYGTTAGGGVISLGTVFQITTNGVFDSLNANSSTGLNQPAAGVMLASDGNLYGTSEAGGTSTNCASGCGAIYRITTDGAVTNLHSFDGSDGQHPKSVLVEGTNGVLYGTTSGSPLGALNCANGCGTVFSITTNGEFTTLHTFTGPEGKLPYAGLVFGNDGNLYGTTSSGGSVFQAGTVFQITTNGVYTKLIAFAGTNGGKPVAPLILAPDGAFYGTTEVGGGTNGAGLGTVFKLTVTVTTNGNNTADLAISKDDAPDPVIVDSNLTYTIVVTNLGTVTATSVTVTDALPASVTFVSASAGCTNIGGNVVCDLGSLASGASSTKSIVVTPTTIGIITNIAFVSSPTNDPSLANNTATAISTVTLIQTDLAVTKTDSPDPATVGGNITYTVTVTNKGPATATIVTLTDTLPGSTTFVSASPGCTNIGGTVTCALGDLGNGATTSVNIVVTANSGGSITNTVSVIADEADPVAGNNTATAVTTVSVPACADLTGSFVSVVPKCKVKTTNTTCSLKGSMAIQNLGTVETVPCTLQFYLSSDAVLDNPGDMPLATATLKAVKTTKAGKAKLKATLPVNVLTSNQFVIAVIDSTSVVTECTETNNVVVFGPLTQ